MAAFYAFIHLRSTTASRHSSAVLYTSLRSHPRLPTLARLYTVRDRSWTSSEDAVPIRLHRHIRRRRLRDGDAHSLSSENAGWTPNNWCIAGTYSLTLRKIPGPPHLKSPRGVIGGRPLSASSVSSSSSASSSLCRISPSPVRRSYDDRRLRSAIGPT